MEFLNPTVPRFSKSFPPKNDRLFRKTISLFKNAFARKNFGFCNKEEEEGSVITPSGLALGKGIPVASVGGSWGGEIEKSFATP